LGFLIPSHRDQLRGVLFEFLGRFLDSGAVVGRLDFAEPFRLGGSAKGLPGTACLWDAYNFSIERREADRQQNLAGASLPRPMLILRKRSAVVGPGALPIQR